jgi:hypothetical protein
MGRHSAPDDDEDGDVLVEAPADDRPAARGRHARLDEDRAPSVDVVAEQAPAAEPAAPPPDPAAPPPDPASVQVGKGDHPTAADLELLRTRPEVRNRVIAAVIAPFVVYTIVMIVVGSPGEYFLWVWLPLVTAGVLGGSILDAAHRKAGRAAKSD